MIYLLDTELNRLGAVNNVASCVVSESLQGEYTASIAIVSDIVEIENTESILEIDGDYFDISLLEIEKTGDKVLQKLELEHVSYRLNNEEYDLEYFTYDGDLRGCVAALLDGTEFSLGDIEQDTEIFTISLQQKITRRAALLALAQQKQTEIFFEKFKVHVKKKRGSDNGVYVRFGKNLKSLRKRVEKKNGNMNLSYDIDVALVDELGSVCVGDMVYVKDDGLKIFSSMRVVQREYDAINLKNQKLTLANYTSDISDLFLSIERSVVKKDTLYNGVKISAENGLEVFRSDGKVRTLLNATEGIKIYSKEHTISMTDDGILINGEKIITHVEYGTLYDSGVFYFKKPYTTSPTVFMQGGTYSFIKDRNLFTGLNVKVTGETCNIVVFGG